MKNYKLLVFHSTHHSLAAEELLKDTGYKIFMIPVLPEITADCGIAVKLKEKVDSNRLLELLGESGIKFAGLYQVIEEKKEKQIKKLS
ncbi:hypothetical protein JCM16358_03750 [Halanaerocella petrolearia]